MASRVTATVWAGAIQVAQAKPGAGTATKAEALVNSARQPAETVGVAETKAEARVISAPKTTETVGVAETKGEALAVSLPEAAKRGAAPAWVAAPAPALVPVRIPALPKAALRFYRIALRAAIHWTSASISP
ncbi:MAG TPA: hypothetical protein VGG85_09195 [Terracidiphilus sp.]